MAPMPDRPACTVADLVIDALRRLGVDTLFCLPGVQNDDFFDRLVDARDIRPVVTRHEQGAAYMAVGAAQVTGRPSAFAVVPGPGLLNAGAALTSGYWSNARALAVVGQIPTTALGRGWGVLHELPDQTAVLRQVTKRAELLVDPAAAAGQIQAAMDAVVVGATPSGQHRGAGRPLVVGRRADPGRPGPGAPDRSTATRSSGLPRCWRAPSDR